MSDRSNLESRKLRRRKKKRFGRIIIFMILIAIGAGVYNLSQMFHDHTVSAASTNKDSFTVTEIAVIASAAKEKEAPTQYNGVKRKVVYLTFDDGPNKHTGDLLDILMENDVKATFFMLGNNMKQNPEMVKRVYQEGHYPGTHSMNHNYSTLYKSGSSTNFINQFTEAVNIVEKYTGYKPMLIRAPYGSAPQIGETLRTDIATAGFKMWDWTLDTLDWKYAKQPEAILSQVKRQLTEDVEVILMHDRKQTVEVLQEIIDYVHSKGYDIEAYDPNAHFVCNFHHDDRL